MKALSLISATLVAATLLSACSKAPATGDAAQKAGTSQAAESKEANKGEARAATYDPNLKPAQIVWDSPEKKRQWEERQAQLLNKTAPQQSAATPAAPAAH